MIFGAKVVNMTTLSRQNGDFAADEGDLGKTLGYLGLTLGALGGHFEFTLRSLWSDFAY